MFVIMINPKMKEFLTYLACGYQKVNALDRMQGCVNLTN
jgi:hypothetical protein